jgi:maltose O-acetyltransferase
MSSLNLRGPAGVRGVLRQKLAENRGREPTELVVRAVRVSARTARSHYCLRKATSIGIGIRIVGHPPMIRNAGILSLGNDIKLEAPVRPIYFNVFRGGELVLGERVYINDGARFECTREIRVGDRATIGFGVVVMDNNFHGVHDRDLRPPGRPVVIENDVWIGAGAILLPGVRIGEGAIVGAGAVVSRDVPPFTLVAGSPARIVRSLDATPTEPVSSRPG